MQPQVVGQIHRRPRPLLEARELELQRRDGVAHLPQPRLVPVAHVVDRVIPAVRRLREPRARVPPHRLHPRVNILFRVDRVVGRRGLTARLRGDARLLRRELLRVGRREHQLRVHLHGVERRLLLGVPERGLVVLGDHRDRLRGGLLLRVGLDGDRVAALPKLDLRGVRRAVLRDRLGRRRLLGFRVDGVCALPVAVLRVRVLRVRVLQARLGLRLRHLHRCLRCRRGLHHESVCLVGLVS
mmetsp:Transcript_6331/g.14703  ORF Transcript_6331/g.14703 Transcript_6331/m.14703 type:complete len:241 (-) Transcript_6331:121-843(-)